MKKTDNYNLALYDKEDKMSVTAEEGSLNANMKIIDKTLKEKANNEDIPKKLSELENDSGYITEYTESDPTVPAHVKAITQNDINKWNNSGGSGLTTEQVNALNEMFKACAYAKDNVNTEYETFKTAFGIDEGTVPTKTLQSISATYAGGNVEAGTNVNTLTGITVKANYSDGTSTNITGYTLSGTIKEGSNTITVTYQGLTTTFIVVGVAESTGGEETNVSNETTWTDGVAYTYTAVDGSYVETGGKITDYASWSRTPYLYCKGASKLRVKVLEPSSQYGGGNGGYNCFYDEDKNFIQSFNFGNLSSTEAGSTVDIDIPANATYLICSGKANMISATNPNVVNGFGKPYLEFIPYT